MHSKNPTQYEKSQTISSYLKQTLMNISYVVKNNSYIYVPTISRKTITLQNSYENAYLLGNRYDYASKQIFISKFQNTIWFSYQKTNEQGDVGWGCMIRVIQMLFAQVFKRYFNKMTLTQIIELFRQQLNGPFSLANICQTGLIRKRFTSGPQIYSVFLTLMKNVKEQYKLGFSAELLCDEVQIKSIQCYSEQQFPKLISINTKIGQKENIEEDFVHHLIHLIKDQRFCGLVSGVASQALFVIGQYQNNAILLDPHYVQKQAESQYFQKIPKGIEFTKLKSGVIISFYIQNLTSFGQWVDYLNMMNRAWGPYTSFSLTVQNQEQWSKNYRKESQDFQLLI